MQTGLTGRVWKGEAPGGIVISLLDTGSIRSRARTGVRRFSLGIRGDRMTEMMLISEAPWHGFHRSFKSRRVCRVSTVVGRCYAVSERCHPKYGYCGGVSAPFGGVGTMGLVRARGRTRLADHAAQSAVDPIQGKCRGPGSRRYRRFGS